jgi:hypothetical protein
VSQIDNDLKRRAQLKRVITEALAEIDRIDTRLLNRIESAKAALLGEEEPKLSTIREQIQRATAEAKAMAARIEAEVRNVTTREPKMKRPITEALANNPLTKDELFEHLTKKGVEIPGKLPKNALSAHISYLIKTGHLVRIGNRLALKQQQLVPGNENATKPH